MHVVGRSQVCLSVVWMHEGCRQVVGMPVTLHIAFVMSGCGQVVCMSIIRRYVCKVGCRQVVCRGLRL